MNTIQYYILIDGSEHGPMSLTRLRAHLLARGVKATDRAWRDGMLGWRPLGTFVNVPALLAEEEKKQSYEPALASVGRRIAATLLDVFAFWLVCVIALFIAMIGARIAGGIKSDHAARLLVFRVLLPTVVLFVAFNLRLLVTRGQTIGKALTGVSIVSLNGQKPGFYRVAILRSLVPTCISVVPLFGQVWLIASGLMFFFGKNNRPLHDRFADTCVIRLPRKLRS